jgi:1-acyl-sn-glycerol-3-phosphate acyltransferase
MNYNTYNYIRKRLFGPYFRIYHRLEVKGLENIPEGPALIVPNHSGGLDLDIACISNFCHPTREIQVLIMDKYHYMNNMWGRYWVGSGIPLWLRGGLKWQYINPYLNEKGSKFPGLVCMFPEGNSGEFRYRNILNKFFPGVVRIALKYEVPIVPTVMIGFHKVSPILKSFYQERGPPDPILFPLITFPFKIIVEFGRPFELSEFYNRKLIKEEEWWIANRIIRPKIAKLKMKYDKVDLSKVDVKMKRP